MSKKSRKKSPAKPAPIYIPGAPSVRNRLESIRDNMVLIGGSFPTHDDNIEVLKLDPLLASAIGRTIVTAVGDTYWLLKVCDEILDAQAPSDDQIEAAGVR